MSETNYADWLKAQFTIHKNKAKADLAKELGLEPPAISKILNGSRQIKAREYMIMRRFFGLPSDGVQSLKHNTNAIKALPPIKNIMHEPEGNDFDWGPHAIITNQHQKPYARNLGSFIVTDQHMEPDFKRDESVLVDLSDKIPTPTGIFVVSDKFSYMVRRCEIVPHSNPPKVIITALEANFQSQTLKLKDFEIIGRVIAKLTWL